MYWNTLTFQRHTLQVANVNKPRFWQVMEMSYSLVLLRGQGSINRHTSFIWPCNFSRIWGVSIINTFSKRSVFYMDCAALHEFWIIHTSLLEACSLIGIVSFIPILILEPCLLIALCPTKISFMSFHSNMTSSMPWGVPNNWNMSSNRNQRVNDSWPTVTTHFPLLLHTPLQNWSKYNESSFKEDMVYMN